MNADRLGGFRLRVLADAQAARERSRRLCDFAAKQKAFLRSQAGRSIPERRIALVERFRVLANEDVIRDG